MAATVYDPTRTYIKYLKKKCVEETTSGCGCEGECSCEDKCSCCPAGTVAIYGADGNHEGCLTPNDAELYAKNTFTCAPGYVMLKNNATEEILGCVSESEFIALYTAVNPPA